MNFLKFYVFVIRNKIPICDLILMNCDWLDIVETNER